jgi:dTDP-glucose 4,6-dehydratase
MKVAITGGCGFIGSNFIRYFSKKHPRFRILNIDKLTYAGNLENLKGFNKRVNYHFIKADICNISRMKILFKKFKPDAVINFAAETHVDRSIIKPDLFLQTNLLGVSNLLNLCLDFRVKKFLQVSTDEVYGSIMKGNFREDSLLTPSSPYAASKAGADGLVMAYHKTYDLPVIITRSSNNYGPYQFPEKFIPLVILNAIKHKPIPVYGDGMNVRDWIYVEDNCAAIDKILDKGKIGEIYNIASKCEKNNLQVIKTLLKIPSIDKCQVIHIKDRPGHDHRYSLSTAKIKRHLGWKPRTSFIAGIKKTVAWYEQNKTWLKNTQTGAYRSFYKKYYSKLGLKDI